METQDTTAKAGVTCPNCGRSFNCEGPPECWCLKVERTFDWEGFIMRSGASSCVCPVCLTGKDEGAAGAASEKPARARRSRRGALRRARATSRD